MKNEYSSTTYLARFMEWAPIGVAMLDAKMHYMAVNQRWLAGYGLTGRSLIGQCHYEMFPDVPKRWREAHATGIDGNVTSCVGDCFERGDGSRRWLNWEIQPWCDAQNQNGIFIFTQHLPELNDFAQGMSDHGTIKPVNQLMETSAKNNGFFHICSHCKMIRDNRGGWQKNEYFIIKSTGMRLSHGLCPECLMKYYGDFLDDGKDRPFGGKRD